MTYEERLYEWISVANEARERLDLPPGVIERGITILRQAFGDEYLETLLPAEGDPQKRIVTAREDEPLGYWLSGPGIDSSVVQALETATVLDSFLADPCLPKKIQRIKTDSFWPFFHELAMAYRVKRNLHPTSHLVLSAEEDTNNGDFVVDTDGGRILCECARLSKTPREQEGIRVTQDIFDYIADKVRNYERRRCVKICVDTEQQRGHFNVLTTLLKRTLEKYERTGEVSATLSQQGLEVSVEPLNGSTEAIPFGIVEGNMVDIVPNEWTHAVSLGYAGADASEVSKMFRAGMSYGFREHSRVFIRYAHSTELTDPYARLCGKIKQKVSQTKTASPDKTGKFIWIDSPYDLRAFDHAKLQADAVEAMRSSRHTLGVAITRREGSPHFRHHYAVLVLMNVNGIPDFPLFAASLDRLRKTESITDPITGWRYHRGWEEAAKRSDRELRELEALRKPNIEPHS